MNKDTAISLGLIATGAAIIIVSQANYINKIEKINRANVIKNNFLMRSLEKAIDKLTDQQWSEIQEEMNVEMEFTDILLNNEM